MVTVAQLVKRTDVRGPTDCWPWLLSTGSHGYGQGWDGSTVRTAHSLWCEAVTGYRFRGIGADTTTIHHLCHNRTCCNPAHMIPLSNRENARDNGQFRQERCGRGHEYARRYPSGKPYCSTCPKERRRSARTTT